MSQPRSNDEILGDLAYHTAAGTAHIKVAEGLSKVDSVVLNSARTFFAMTIDAHLLYALMAAARMHDDQGCREACHRFSFKPLSPEADKTELGQ